MRILWSCNVILPIIAKAMELEENPFGGWYTGLLNELSKVDNLEIGICFPLGQTKNVFSGKVEDLCYWGYRDDEQNESRFISIIQDFKPDIIHVWGTEYKHSLDMINAAEKCNMLDHTGIDLQGIVSYYAKYHYYANLPESLCKSATLTEKKNHCNIESNRQKMLHNGIYEVEALRKAKFVFGRTDWDEACAKQINPNLQYFRCNRLLRDSFYENKWNYEDCVKHTIFVGQASYPIKGFHHLIEALPLIIRHFPDTQVFATGNQLFIPQNFRQKIRQLSYPKYLLKLIKENDVAEHITFLGRLSEEQMCSQFLRSNVSVSPSSIENASNAIEEAMILGLPVVASDVGGIKNFMVHEKEGFLYQADAPYMLAYYICKVFENPLKAIGMGENARKHALISHDREKVIADMMDIYQHLLL